MEPNFWQSKPVKTMSLIIAAMLIVFLGLGLITKGYDVFLFTKYSAVSDNILYTSGTEKIKTYPDKAMLSFNYTGYGETTVEAIKALKEKTKVLKDTLKTQGIADVDIYESSFILSDLREYSGRPANESYRSENNLSVTLSGDKDALSKKITDATAPALEQGWIVKNGCLYFDDIDNKLKEPKKKALDKARKQAEELAAMSDLKLGKIINVNDSTDTQPYSTPIMGYDNTCDNQSGPNGDIYPVEIITTIGASYELK